MLLKDKLALLRRNIRNLFEKLNNEREIDYNLSAQPLINGDGKGAAKCKERLKVLDAVVREVKEVLAEDERVSKRPPRRRRKKIV